MPEAPLITAEQLQLVDEVGPSNLIEQDVHKIEVLGWGMVAFKRLAGSNEKQLR